MVEVPYQLTRVGTVMVPDPDRAEEAEGVLNPASGYGPDGRLYLLPRVVAEGNYSRVGLAEVLLDEGVPVSVERRGVVLEPDEAWEHGADHGGVEDPRVTWVPDLGVHIMTYVAYGPMGPRLALASSEDLRSWRRLGPVLFGYEPDLQLDFNLFPNKDAVFFPEPVPGPDGEPCWAMLHRPMWDLGWIREGEGDVLPVGLDDPRPGIWISYVPVDEVGKDVSRLVRLSGHRLVALSQHGVRGHQDRRWATAAPGPRGLAVAASRRVGGDRARVRAAAASGVLRRRDDPVRRRPWQGPGADLGAAHVSGQSRRAGRHGVERRLPHVHRGDARRNVRVLRDGGRPDRRRSLGPGGLRIRAGEGQPVTAFTVATWAMPGPRTCTGVGPAAMNTASPWATTRGPDPSTTWTSPAVAMSR